MELDGSTVVTAPPFVEVEMCYEPPLSPGTKVTGRGWAALRLETKNHIYELEWSMKCFAVRDRVHETLIPDHKLLGARLTGGQLRASENLELTYPLPRPGVSAVFELPGGRHEYMTTSEVLRVVLRMRVIGVAEKEARPQWKELSDSFHPVQPPPPAAAQAPSAPTAQPYPAYPHAPAPAAPHDPSREPPPGGGGTKPGH